MQLHSPFIVWQVRRIFWPLLLLCLSIPLAWGAERSPPPALTGRVVRVVDGDTVVLLTPENSQVKIRLAGIDAPESHQPYGKQAREQLATLVAGQEVVAQTRKQDRYGRTIATLLVAGRDANLAMLQTGWAWHYRQYAHEQPTAEASSYAQAEQVARAEHLGLWRDCAPIPPWEWRHHRASVTMKPAVTPSCINPDL